MISVDQTTTTMRTTSRLIALPPRRMVTERPVNLCPRRAGYQAAVCQKGDYSNSPSPHTGEELLADVRGGHIRQLSTEKDNLWERIPGKPQAAEAVRRIADLVAVALQSAHDIRAYPRIVLDHKNLCRNTTNAHGCITFRSNSAASPTLSPVLVRQHSAALLGGVVLAKQICDGPVRNARASSDSESAPGTVFGVVPITTRAAASHVLCGDGGGGRPESLVAGLSVPHRASENYPWG
jgi:hypothetical protein